jgi:hypothetical protein
MTRWLLLSAAYTAAFALLADFKTEQAIAAGLACGGMSILVTKLFGMDKKD